MARGLRDARQMLMFGSNRIATDINRTFSGLNTALEGVVGPAERVGNALQGLVAGGGKALGGLVATVGDTVGTAVSMVSTLVSGTLSGLLKMIPYVGGALGGLVNVLGAISSSLGGLLGTATRFLGEVLTGVSQVLGTAAGGLASGIVLLGTHATQTAASFEQMAAAFTVMTGSGAKAKAILEDAIQFAAVTPFEIKDIVSATQKLTAMGIEAGNALKMVKQLSNIAAAMPDSMADNLNRVVRALGEMHAKGRVQAEEMTRQLANAGIPAWEALAKRIGKTTEETMALAQAGRISAREGIMAILDLAASPRFAQMNAIQNATLRGQWSNLRDNVTLFMRDIGDSIARGFNLKGAVQGVSEFLATLRSNLASVQPLINIAGAAFQVLVDILKLTAQQVVALATRWAGSVSAMTTDTLRLKLMVIDALESMLVGAVTFANRFQIGFGVAIGQFADFLERATRVAAAFGIALLAVGAAASLAWGASAGGPAGVLAALTVWIGATEAIRSRLEGLPQAARAGIDGLRQFGMQIENINIDRGVQGIRDWANSLRQAAVAGSQVAVAARVVAAGFMPLGTAIAMASNNLMQFVATAAKAQYDVKFGQFGKEVADAIKVTRGPFSEFQEQIKNTQIAIQEMGVHAAHSIGLGFINPMLLADDRVQKTAQGITALNRQLAQSLLNKGKDLFQSRDVGAMEAGSKEAVAAINRAFNEQRASDLTAEQIQRAILEQERQHNAKLDKLIAQGLLNKGVNLGFVKP